MSEIEIGISTYPIYYLPTECQLRNPQENHLSFSYGRDARIPTDSVLYHVRSPYAIDVEDYKEELLSGLTLAWKLARDNIQKAQGTQTKL